MKFTKKGFAAAGAGAVVIALLSVATSFRLLTIEQAGTLSGVVVAVAALFNPTSKSKPKG